MRLLFVTLLMATACMAAPKSSPKSHWRTATEPIPDYKIKTRNMNVVNPFKTGPTARIEPRTPLNFKPTTPSQAEACSVENPSKDAKVIGGDEASDGQFPWLALVLCDDPGWLCTGSFIYENFVLTAGHCVHDCNRFKIYAGAHSRDAIGTPGDDTQEITVSQDGNEFEEPDYNPLFLRNDLGLIQLPEAIDLARDDISLSCLPTQAMVGADLAGQFATIVGWGLTEDNGDAADIPNYAHDRQVISTDLCQAVWGDITVTDEGTICTGVGSSDIGTCNGDSGGPLNLQPAEGDYSSYIQIGVVSFGPGGSCVLGLPDGFARVDGYLDWIEESTGIPIP